MAPRTIIISGADQAYWPLLSGLLNSIDKRRRSAAVAVGILDLGLSAEQVERLRRYGAEVVSPGWDYDISRFASAPPAFFKAMRGPLPQIRLMPTGGVDTTTATEFLKAGDVVKLWIENIGTLSNRMA